MYQDIPMCRFYSHRIGYFLLPRVEPKHGMLVVDVFGLHCILQFRLQGICNLYCTDGVSLYHFSAKRNYFFPLEVCRLRAEWKLRRAWNHKLSIHMVIHSCQYSLPVAHCSTLTWAAYEKKFSQICTTSRTYDTNNNKVEAVIFNCCLPYFI